MWKWFEHVFELFSKCCFMFKEVVGGREVCMFV
jgi:hypothetical protein